MVLDVLYSVLYCFTLESLFNHDDFKIIIIRKVLALPFLPSEHIRPAFDGIRAKAQGEQVTSLLNYVEGNWLLSTVWQVSSWSIFG